MKIVIAALFATVSAATAGPLQQGPESPRFALAVNSPISWAINDSGGPAAVAGSGYIAINRHQVVRLNAAWWRPPGYGELLAVFAGDASECAPGRAIDGGAGWMYFPRERFRGLSLEAGGLVRRKQQVACDPFDYSNDVRATSTIVAARGLVGWNWLVGNHFYLAAAAGGSVGDERGTQVRAGDHMTWSIQRVAVAPEFYIRLGWAFL